VKSAATHSFRLYVAGESPNSVKARANLGAICSKFLEGRHSVEIIDVLEHPEVALADQVMLTPMLVQISPAPVRSVIGNLSNFEAVMGALNLPPRPA